MATDFYGIISKQKLKYKQQGFSGTDLDRNIKDTGIVYPLKQADGLQASFSSIVDHENGDTILAHSEYRLARNVPDNIEYIKGICFTVVNQDSVIEKSTEAEELLGIAPYINILKESYLVSEPGTKEFNKEYFTKYDEMLASLDFEPVYIIEDKNLSEKKPTISYKTNSLWQSANPIWSNLEESYSEKIFKDTFGKKVPRKDIEKDIYILRTDIAKLCKQNNFDIAVLDENIQLLLNSNLLEYTYEELLQVKLELEDLYWDIMCEDA